jgi:hypothetical protein
MRTLKTEKSMLSVLLGAVAVSLLALALLAPGAGAADPFSLTGFDGTMTSDPAGDPATQAGSHPYAVGAHMSFAVDSKNQPAQNPKEIDVELPVGLIGNPASAPRCKLEALTVPQIGSPEACPENTQVGVATVEVASSGFTIPLKLPIWNMVPPPGSPAMFGFMVLVDPVTVTATVRPEEAPGQTGGLGSYGIDLHLKNISQGVPLAGSGLTFWGNPADPRHDAERGACLLAPYVGKPAPKEPCTFQGPARPFMTLPSTCTGEPLVTRTHVTSWLGEEDSAEFPTHDAAGNPYALEGCDKLPFAGDLSTALETSAADSPSGLTVDLQVPQNENTTGLATAHLKRAVVTLPPGVSVDPSAANGLTSCSVAQFDQFSEGPADCPASSKIGTVEIDTPLLDKPMDGSVYLARQNENPFGSLLAIYLVAEEAGVRLKLAGKVSPNPITGQLVTTFDDNPQLPFTDLKLRFFSGPRAALATPTTCGTQATSADLGPWSSGPVVGPEGALTISSGPNGSACPASAGARPFGLGLEAGTGSNAAGRFSPFAYKLTRPDGAQEMSRIEAELPKGVMAKLAGVPECADAAAAAGTCGAESQIGTVEVGAGAGTNPFYVRGGRAYLTGPYAGAPLGLDFVVPAVAGPIDLGLVNVRAGVFVDPTTAQVSVKSDPLPKILQGIPLRIRSVQIGVDRQGFMLNPTNCNAAAIGSSVGSTEGTVVRLSDRFQAAGCGDLAFKPKLALRLSGAPPRRGANPALRATVTPASGDANIGKAAVILPATELLEQAHIKTVCTRVQFGAGECPAGSIYGHAKAWTPLLDRPLEGPVYLRSNGGERKLPDLVADLNGQIHLVLVGYLDSVKRHGSPRIRTRFLEVPDAPVSRFVLEMQRGKKSLLANTTNLCKAKPRAEADLRGQNGKNSETRPLVKVSGCGGKGSKGHKQSKSHKR